MLIARAPVRISLAGGGTDLAAYYEPFGGLVVSAAINKYFYTLISLGHPGDGIQIISSDYHTFFRHDPQQPFFWRGDLPLPRAILHHFGLDRGYNLFLASEVPPGTGLGSSGTVAVTLVRALSTLCDRPMSRQAIAETACYIEIEKMGMPVGKQDQYISAFGGLNKIHFSADGVTVEPLWLNDAVLAQLEERLVLFFTGSTRESSNILQQQKRASEEKAPAVIDALHSIKALAHEVAACLERGDLDGFGELLHASWDYKKRLSAHISTPLIDRCYAIARAQGALGGKVTGAGGGGFLLLYCPVERQAAVTRALEAEGLIRMNFRFDFQGASVVLNTLSRSNGFHSQAIPAVLNGQVGGARL